MSFIKKSLLPGGVTVATESLPHADSVCIGVWVDVGSRDENREINGLAHLFEHMTFKGTPSRSALDIVKCLEASGGQINAFTTREQTCFYARVVESEQELALETLIDMVFNPSLAVADLKKEKEIIIEELRGYDDNPEEFVYDLFSTSMFKYQNIGLPIAGVVGSVRKLSHAHLLRHLKNIREKWPVYVVAAGKLNHGDVVRTTRRLIKQSGIKAQTSVRRPVTGRNAVEFYADRKIKKRGIQQAHVVLGTAGYGSGDPRCYPLMVLNNIIGEGMSSRLFQKLREEHSCVYNIHSYMEAMIRAGLFGISFNTEPKYLKKAMTMVSQELRSLKENGISEEELEFSKHNLIGTFLLDMESSQSRMAFLARLIMRGGHIDSRNKYLQSIKKTSMQDIRKVASDLFHHEKWSMASVLPKRMKVSPGSYLNF